MQDLRTPDSVWKIDDSPKRSVLITQPLLHIRHSLDDSESIKGFHGILRASLCCLNEHCLEIVQPDAAIIPTELRQLYPQRNRLTDTKKRPVKKLCIDLPRQWLRETRELRVNVQVLPLCTRTLGRGWVR